MTRCRSPALFRARLCTRKIFRFEMTAALDGCTLTRHHGPLRLAVDFDFHALAELQWERLGRSDLDDEGARVDRA
jgi:hypothetical protein